MLQLDERLDGPRASTGIPELARGLTSPVAAVRVPTEAVFEQMIENYRREMTAYCYRMLGSWDEAEDAVQDTYFRAWRALDSFEGRSQLRSWLYKIATNVSLTMLDGRRRRALPMDLEAPSSSAARLGEPVPDAPWIQPVLDRDVIDLAGDPADVAASRETIRLAFIAALQHLPARQRAVLILRDVLRWRASEVADLLDITVVSANGLLRRARATLAERDVAAHVVTPTTEWQRDLLARYVDAFERLDVDTLVALLHEDAVLSMPPYTLWLQGSRAIAEWLVANACGDSKRMAVVANGSPAFAVYKATSRDGCYEAFAIEIIDVAAEGIGAIHAFIEPELFPRYGLPATLLVPV
jgi:RNA polymerase sigma-70 factor (ECF subfamily)